MRMTRTKIYFRLNHALQTETPIETEQRNTDRDRENFCNVKTVVFFNARSVFSFQIDVKLKIFKNPVQFFPGK